MQIQPKTPTTKGPATMFTGDVWFDVIAKGEAPSRMRVNTVRFSPGARTAWHAHAVGQTLHVVEGIGPNETGHYLRQLGPTGAESLGMHQRRLSSNRGNAYLPPIIGGPDTVSKKIFPNCCGFSAQG